MFLNVNATIIRADTMPLEGRTLVCTQSVIILLKMTSFTSLCEESVYSKRRQGFEILIDASFPFFT